MTRVRPTYAEIDLDAIRHNVEVLADRAGDADVCAVVKADGYGHGAVPVARAALEAGATWLAVALVEEGEELRQAGLDAPILLLSEPPNAAADRILAAGITPAVYTLGFLAAMDAAARDRDTRAEIHLKADTGMGRVGAPEEDWDGLLAAATDADHVDVTGLWTHLARADEPDVSTTERQLDRFDRFLDRARGAGIEPDFVHAANSAATLAHPRAHHDLVRVGIAMYGLSPAPQLPAADFDLRPAMRFVTEVAYAKRITAGTAVSYGHTWEAPADGWLATLPVGYADGVPRLVSNRVDVLVRGARRPVAGNVCMDQVMVWCGDQKIEIGDEVVLLGGQDGARITADEWAEAAETITYEIATSITARVPRTYLGA